MLQDLSPGDFVHVIGDAHVYRTHVRALEEQIQKMPKPFPVSNSCQNYFQNKYKICRLKWDGLTYVCKHPVPKFYVGLCADFENKSFKEGYWFFRGIRLQACWLWSSPEDRDENGDIMVAFYHFYR